MLENLRETGLILRWKNSKVIQHNKPYLALFWYISLLICHLCHDLIGEVNFFRFFFTSPDLLNQLSFYKIFSLDKNRVFVQVPSVFGKKSISSQKSVAAWKLRLRSKMFKVESERFFLWFLDWLGVVRL